VRLLAADEPAPFPFLASQIWEFLQEVYLYLYALRRVARCSSQPAPVFLAPQICEFQKNAVSAAHYDVKFLAADQRRLLIFWRH